MFLYEVCDLLGEVISRKLVGQVVSKVGVIAKQGGAACHIKVQGDDKRSGCQRGSTSGSGQG